MLLKKRVPVVLIVLILLINLASVSFGNAAEPPYIMIIVPNAPDDLDIGIGSNESFTKAKVVDKKIEKYYIFYSRDLGDIKEAPVHTLKIDANGHVYEISFDKPPQRYQNIYTLNLESRTLNPGKSTARSITLVLLRVTMTLLIEGLVFFLFGFRHRRSWLAFLIINLLTQGALNIWINGLFSVQSYWFFGLVLIEVLITIAETVAVLCTIKEHGIRRIFFAITANFLSFAAGAYLIAVLPF